MNIQVTSETSVAGLEKALNKVLNEDNNQFLIILSCDGNDLTPDTVDPILKNITLPLCGGIFPAIINDKEKMEKGSIVIGLPYKGRIEVVPDLSSQNSDYVQTVDDIIPAIDDFKTMFVFVDGFASQIGSFISSLFTVFGLQFNYIGGGAGSLSMVQKPCLFTNDGLIMDSAVMALLDIHSGVGVSHGWRSISGPYKVTDSDRNVVKSIEWEPAFEIYKKVIHEHSGNSIDENNFFEIAKAYPFGITRLGSERIVRDPIMVDPDQSMVCVGEMPEGTFIDILNGDEASLIKAAGSALEQSQNAFGNKRDVGLSIFIDCISRVLFLGDRFDEELNAVHVEGHPLVGACTIGEIANSGNDYLEFYNKTSVVGILENK